MQQYSEKLEIRWIADAEHDHGNGLRTMPACPVSYLALIDHLSERFALRDIITYTVLFSLQHGKRAHQYNTVPFSKTS